LVIVLSVLRFTSYDYPFGILKLLICSYDVEYNVPVVLCISIILSTFTIQNITNWKRQDVICSGSFANMIMLSPSFFIFRSSPWIKSTSYKYRGLHLPRIRKQIHCVLYLTFVKRSSSYRMFSWLILLKVHLRTGANIAGYRNQPF
jgi:hypothetical protein